jgi:hypothetical protein
VKTHVHLWWILTAFFLVVAVIYTIWSSLAHPGVPFVQATEWVGSIALLFTALMAALIAFYMGRVRNAQRGELPEDILTADIDDGDPELGEFSPWSWWPIVLAFSASLAILGLAVGTWLMPIGIAVFIIAIVGWVYEYYRGHFAR